MFCLSPKDRLPITEKEKKTKIKILAAQIAQFEKH